MFSYLPTSFLSWCASNISDKFLVALCILFVCVCVGGGGGGTGESFLQSVILLSVVVR